MKTTGYEKLYNLVERNHGKRLGIARMIKQTGLTAKSIFMYTSWNGFGSFRKGYLNVA